MEFREIKDNFKRDYNEEKEILENFSSILKSYISNKEIKDTLEKNGFEGVYVLEDDAFKEFNPEGDIVGCYNNKSKIIVLKKADYLFNKAIGVHEMGHAFLNGRSRSEIQIDCCQYNYGIGLEEGAVSLLENTKSIKDISNINRYSYFIEARLFKQLSELYNYTSVKEYPNLLIHMFKEPERFISLIKDIYQDIFSYADPMAITKSAFYMIQGTDMITECKNYDAANRLQLMNSLYLSVADKDIRNGDTINPLFVRSKYLVRSREERLLCTIFGDNDTHLKKYYDILENLLTQLQLLFEDIEFSMESDSSSKILLPRKNYN